MEYKEHSYSPFQESVLAYAKKKFPETYNELTKTIERTFEDQERRNKLLEIIEQIVEMKSLSELSDEELLEGGIERRDDETYIIAVSTHFHEKRLPKGYGYKGGAARSLLLRNIGLDPTSLPRDIDIIRLTEEEPESRLDEKLAEEYMPDDLAQGYGVEHIDDTQEYLDTRDLTMNELYATDDFIVATDACLRDTIRGIIRQTDYEYEQYYDDIGPKMLAKMLRFYAEALSRGMDFSLDTEVEKKLEEYGLTWFWMALNLDKAAEIGSKVANQYIEELKKRKQIPDHLDDIEQVTLFLYKQMGPGNFYFRYAPAVDYIREENWIQ